MLCTLPFRPSSPPITAKLTLPLLVLFPCITPFKLSKDERRATVFLSQQPRSLKSSPLLLLSPGCYTLWLRLCRILPCSTFLILSQNLSPFCLSLSCYQLWRFPSPPRSQKTVIFFTHCSSYIPQLPCGETMILFKTLLKTSLPSAAYMCSQSSINSQDMLKLIFLGFSYVMLRESDLVIHWKHRAVFYVTTASWLFISSSVCSFPSGPSLLQLGFNSVLNSLG